MLQHNSTWHYRALQLHFKNPLLANWAPHTHTHPAIHPFGDVIYEQPLGDLGRRSGHQQPLSPRFLCHHAGKSCHQLDVTMQKSAKVFENLS